MASKITKFASTDPSNTHTHTHISWIREREEEEEANYIVRINDLP